MTEKLETSGSTTVIVPWKAFLLLAASENLNFPALEKVQLALPDAAITSGTAAPQFIPFVELNTGSRRTQPAWLIAGPL